MAIPFIFFLLVGALVFYIVVQCGISIAHGLRQKQTKKVVTGVVSLVVLVIASFLMYNMSKELFIKYDLWGLSNRKVEQQ
ncbi:MAG: hypothetical protein EOP56_02380 [Sphingobacteriales bacterium]|nr:MAG: hypothetical protein EOP56_02380 [Sphingobacteriales bacterium]